LTKAPEINEELKRVIRRKKREPRRERKALESSMDSAAAASAPAANPAMNKGISSKNRLVQPESGATLTSQQPTGLVRSSTRGTDHAKVLKNLEP
jgi:hypothetical protein